MIKFLLTAAAILFFSVAGIQYSKADDGPACKVATTQEALDKLSAIQGIEVQEVPKGIVNALVTKKGLPPGAEDGEDLVMYLASSNGNSALFIMSHGCLVNRVGPAPTQDMMNFLGAVNA